MILDGILNVVSGLLGLLLSPLQLINISVDWFSSFSFIEDFFAVVVYMLPWGNLMPLIVITIAVILFKVVISFIKTLWNLIPGL